MSTLGQSTADGQHIRGRRDASAAWRAALATPLALLAVLLSAAAASAQDGSSPGSDGQAPGEVGPHQWSVEPFTLDVTTGPDDGLTLAVDADLYIPDGVGAEAPAPAMLVTHGFGGTKDNAESVTLAAYFASHGYVVASWTSFGFGGSEGCIALDSIDWDAKTAATMIDHLVDLGIVATGAEGDPRVGMIGGSYGGGSQPLVAVIDPRLDAIAPGRTWNSLQYSLDPNNWIADPARPLDLDGYEQGVFKQEWTTLFFSLGASQPAQGNGGCDPVTQQTLFPGAEPCPGFLPELCEIMARLTATGETTADGRALVARSSAATFIDEVDVPTILAQGIPDTLFNVNDATATFTALRDRGVPAALIWHDGGHGGYPGAPGEGEPFDGKYGAEADPEAQAAFASSYWARRHLQWMERHVRGRDVDTGPAFAWFRDWIDYDVDATGGTAAPAYYGAEEFPPALATATTFGLDPADGELVADDGSVDGGSASILNPPGGEPAAYSETSNFSGPGQPFADVPASEIPGQHVAFTTTAFDRPHDLVGIPTARLHLSHADTSGDLVLFAKLYDLAPDGSATLIHRQVAPARVPTEELADPVEVRLVGTAHRFDAGHAVRLVLATTDQAYYNRKVADEITLTSTAAAPSTVTLPLIAAAAPPAPTPPDPGGGAAVAPPAPAGPALPATGGGAALLGILALTALAAMRRRR